MSVLSPHRLRQLHSRAEREVAAGAIPSCQYALALDGEVVAAETIGAPTSSRYMIFSATKPLVASVVWQLIGTGDLDPALPVSTWWPEFAGHGKHEVTLDHVLLHTAGFPYAPMDYAIVEDRSARVRQMEEWTLDWEPGTRYVYHPLSAHWVLAELIARATGQDHRDAVRDRVLGPLGLDRLELGAPLDRQEDVRDLVTVGEPLTPEQFRAATGLDIEAPDAALVDLGPLNEPAVRAAGVPGAGGVSDAASLALFHQALLHDSRNLWDPEVLTDGTRHVRNTLPDPLAGTIARTRGLETTGHGDGALFRIGAGATSPETFGHNGAHGQIAWTDPTNGLTFTFLTDGADQDVIREFQRGADLCRLALACVNGAGPDA